MQKISIIVPCYNEISTIETVLNAVNASSAFSKEVIVVDDCSIDGTRELLRTKLAGKYAKLLCHPQNLGKGAAIRSGLQVAQGDIILIQDADLEYNPQEHSALLAPIINGTADVVYGSRFQRPRQSRTTTPWHKWANQLLTMLSNQFTGLHLTDMETGHKAFRRDIVQSIKLEQNRFGFEPEITAKIARIPGIRVQEVEISYAARGYDAGKKIGWKDGIQAIYCIVKYGLLKR